MKHPTSYDTTDNIRKRMSKVRLKDGKAESILAKSLWKNGLRYRKNYKKLPGSPDIAITTSKVAIFVDGEFWHGKDWAIRKDKLKHNREYWIEKIEENIARDINVNNKLNQMGWHVYHFWYNDVMKDLDSCIKTIMADERIKK